jgi:hypothetical protein
MSYVNACSGDWWAGGSFSNRRFDSLLPVLALGLAASLEASVDFVRRRPGTTLALSCLPFVLWNLTLVAEVRQGLAPRDDTVFFPELAGSGARVFNAALGSPLTWPASWLFAFQTGRPPGQYDLLVGRYLFYRQNNLGGHVAVVEGDDALLGEGWRERETHEGLPARRVRGRSRFFAPLDIPEDLEISFRAAASPPGQEVSVLVNEREAGRFWAAPLWGEGRLLVPQAFWKRELNDVVLLARGDLWISSIDFERTGRAR